jgi:hypothetical protein
MAKAGLGIRFNEHMEGDGETVFRHACNRLHRKPAALVTIGPKGPTRQRRFRITQHHHGVTRGRHQVVALLVNAAILAVIQPKFFEPLIQVL